MNGAVQSVGERLKAARDSKGFSAQKAADALHLDPWVIEALESGDYARVGPSVYVKGHLKRYAALLDLPPEEVVQAYVRGPSPGVVATPPSPSDEPTPALRVPAGPFMPRPSWLRPAALTVLVIAAAGAYLSRVWQRHAAPVSASPAAAPAATSGQGGTSAAEASPPAATPTPKRSDFESSAAPSVADQPARAVPAPVAGGDDALTGAGHARLRLSFSADSWVDVHDAAGRRLFAGKGRANSVRTIAGDAPMRVYIGFASGVQLQVNSRVVAIGPQFVAGDVARFEAGADGVLRRDAHATATAASSPHPRG